MRSQSPSALSAGKAAPATPAERRRRWMRVRIVLLGALLMAFAASIVHRAHELQIERAPALREMAEAQYLRDIRLSPKRGNIVDRHGAVLAVSVDVESVYGNPREMLREGGEPLEIARQLGAVLGIDVERIAARFALDRLFVWVQRRITPSQAAEIRALRLPGIHMVEEARRYYPNRELAAHLLGFANIDGVGIEGLELHHEEQLHGSVATVSAVRDRRGAVVFSEQFLDDRAARGDDIVLTIDKTIQHAAERELALAVQTFEAQAGSVVVMDPRTGEILALANFPTFNPNEPGDSPAAHRRNRAITDRFEPGSTVKPFTIAAALAAQAIRPGELIDCGGGSMEVAEYVIHDSTPHDELTPAQILAFSSNIGTARIGERLGRRGLFRAFRGFGFGERTGLPLPGETAGILRHHRRWYEMDAATISFGQGMSVTTVQLAAAMGAIANGGRLMEPILVRRVSDARGEVLEEGLPRIRRRIVPEATARLVGDMLTAVTGPGGTAPEAAIDGFLVAGKTGTAQKADYVHGGYAEDRWLASFVGFVPAEEPRLVIAVVIDEPIIAHYGGQVAGPVFRRVGSAALRHLGVPSGPGRRVLAEQVAQARERAAGRAAAEAEAGVDGPEGALAPALAMPGIELSEQERLVPDLMGGTARATVRALSALSLRPLLDGSGVVVGQDPPPGVIVEEGSGVRVTLSPPTSEPPREPAQPPLGPGGAAARSGIVARAEVPR